jgi:fructokinase
MARIVVFGEILWDCLPSGPRLGGAPLNVAANLSLLDNEVILVSAVGKDDFGDKALEMLREYHVNTEFVGRSDYPTGTVEVSLDEEGDASYSFTPDCAWHNIGGTMGSRRLPEGDALLYGSLANHYERNWQWFEEQLRSFNGVTICDINLREPWDLNCARIVSRSAQLLKCNESEFEALTGIKPNPDNQDLLATVRKKDPSFPEQLCVTFGKEGAIYISEKNEIFQGSTKSVEVVDSIGAGDAFLAGLVDQLVQGEGCLPINFLDRCCAMGAEAATRSGALPELS